MQGMYDLSGPARRFRPALPTVTAPRRGGGSQKGEAGLRIQPIIGRPLASAGGREGIFKDDNDDNFS